MKIRFLLFSLVILILIIAPRLGTLTADYLLPYFDEIDPDRIFMWGIIHHIVQALVPVIFVFIWKRKLFETWGFSTGDIKTGLRWVLWFTLVWVAIYTGLTAYNIYFDINPYVYYDVTNFRNLLGELTFRGLIVGPSEEILFRAFPISILLLAGFSKDYKIFNQDISQAGIISAILFALAHIGLNIIAFEVYHFNIVQLITSLGFGLLYAIVYQKTKSIYYPMIIHAISDVLPVLSLFIIKTIY